MTARVFYYVQHLLGVGHLKRASLIAKAMAAHGLEVWVALGGPDVEGIAFDGCARILLPPVHAADASFKVLLDADGVPIDDVWRDNRAARLLAEFAAVEPDIVLIEMFPFGRRQFRFELMPLLAAARTAPRKPKIAASIRDVLVHKQDPARNREMVTLARDWFDRILVHGDPRLITLEETFPEAAEISPLIAYTGYVVDDAPLQARGREDGRGEVVVSVGGGAVGEPLLRVAQAARPLTRLAETPWRFVCGPNIADDVYDSLAWNPPDGIIVDRVRTDLATLIANCVLSISQVGYNTVMEVLRANARAIVVPFAEGGETEQQHRARVLADRGVISVVEPGSLSPKVLAETVDRTLAAPPSGAIDIDLTGAAASARIVAALCGSPPAV